VIMRAVFGVSDPARREAMREGLVALLSEAASPVAFGLTLPVIKELPHYRRFAAKAARTDELLAEEIEERRRDPDVAERDDILSMLVSAEFDDGTKMSNQELRDQLLTLLLAGHETTATALAWTFDLLLHTPATLDRLLAELETDETAYLEAVIDESLRVRPVVPMTGRLLREPANLGGYDLETDTVVFAAIYMLHTNPEVYPDPYAFQPERFLEDGPETYSWIPFGGGTRRCIGAAFAELELRVVLREVLRSVRLEAADPKPQRMVRRNVTLTPADGTRVIAQPL
jgi:cytochrome P450